MTRASYFRLLAMYSVAFVPAIIVTACEQKKPACVDKVYRNMECSEDQRIEVHGSVAVCRCVRPEPAVSR